MFKEVDNLAGKFDSLCTVTKTLSRRSRGILELECFSGDPSENVITFIKNFERKMSILEYEEAQFVHFMARLLVGRASAWLELASPDTISSWHSLRSALITEFTSTRVKEQARRELISASKKASESVLEYVARIKRLAKLVYDEDNDKYIRDFVVRGLPSNLQHKIRHKNIAALNDLINMVERYEAEEIDRTRAVNMVMERNSNEPHKVTARYKNRSGSQYKEHFTEPRAQSRHYANHRQPRVDFNPSHKYESNYTHPVRDQYNRARGARYNKYNTHFGRNESRDHNWGQRSNRNHAFRPNYNSERVNPYRGQSNFRTNRETPSENQNNVNNILPIENSTTTPEAASSPLAQNFFPTYALTLVTVLACFLPLTSAISSSTYQFCAHGRNGLLFSPPSTRNCSIHNSAEYTFFMPCVVIKRKEKLVVSKAYACYNITRTVCTSSFFHVTLSVDKDQQFRTALDFLSCQQANLFKKIGSIDLYKVNARIYRSSSSSSYSFPLLGSRCSSISTYFLEYGTVSTTDENSIMTNLTDPNACRYNEGKCSSPADILIWDVAPTENRCLYERLEKTIAMIKANYVILEKYKIALNLLRLIRRYGLYRS